MNAAGRVGAGRQAWYVVAVLSLLYAFSIIERLIMPISIEQVRRSLGVSDFQVSLMMGLAFALFYTLCGLPLGVLIDRGPRRWVVFCGVLLWSLAAAAGGLAATAGALFAARMLVGAGEAALSPASYSMLSDLFARDRLAAPLSVYTFGGTLGSAIALAGGGALLQYYTLHGGLTLPVFGHLLPWQSLYVSAGLPGLAVALLVFTFPEPVRHGKAGFASAGSPVRIHSGQDTFAAHLAAHRRLYVLLFAGFSAVAMLSYGYASWIPALMMRSYGLQPAETGRIFGLIVAACGLTAHGLNGFAVDWLFRRGHTDAHLKFYIVSALFSAPMVALGFHAGRWGWLLAGVTAAYLILTPFVGYAAAALQIITPAHLRGRMSALYLFVISAFGVGLGPSVVAALTQFVFRSEGRLGDSLAAFTVVFAALAALTLGLACRRFRLAVAEGAMA